MTSRLPPSALGYLLLGAVLTVMTTVPVLAASLAPSQASMPGTAISLNQQIVDLTLDEAVFLGLRNNYGIRSAYFERIAQKFDLRVEEDRFTPKLVLSARHIIGRNQDERYRQTDAIPATTLLSKYGTRLSLSWSNQLSQGDLGRTRNDGATFSIIQPLLRGAGRDVVTAPLRSARLAEQSNLLSLKATVADTITRIIIGYHELLRAQQQLQIVRDALLRSHQLLEANKAMIAAGRMAEFEIVQTEANAATQELAVEEAANQLDASRLDLLRLLGIDLGTRIRAIEKPEAQRFEVNLAQALAITREQQPTYLKQLIATEQAAINLTLARNERLWDVSLVGGASQVRDRYWTSVGNDSSRAWEGYGGIQVDIPIGDLSSRQAEVRARVNVENQGIRLAEIRQELERNVNDTVRNLETRWRQYEIAQRARALTQKKLEIEREKLQAGRSSNFQVLSFEADLRNAESAQLNALIAYLNAQAILDETLGTTLKSWDIELND